jgi:hypothetical protein
MLFYRWLFIKKALIKGLGKGLGKGLSKGLIE